MAFDGSSVAGKPLEAYKFYSGIAASVDVYLFTMHIEIVDLHELCFETQAPRGMCQLTHRPLQLGMHLCSQLHLPIALC